MFKICKNCGKEYECYNKLRLGKKSSFKTKRPFNSVNCSKKCSREYDKFYRKSEEHRNKQKEYRKNKLKHIF